MLFRAAAYCLVFEKFKSKTPIITVKVFGNGKHLTLRLGTLTDDEIEKLMFDGEATFEIGFSAIVELK